VSFMLRNFHGISSSAKLPAVFHVFLTTTPLLMQECFHHRSNDVAVVSQTSRSIADAMGDSLEEYKSFSAWVECILYLYFLTWFHAQVFLLRHRYLYRLRKNTACH